MGTVVERKEKATESVVGLPAVVGWGLVVGSEGSAVGSEDSAVGSEDSAVGLEGSEVGLGLVVGLGLEVGC